VSFLLDTDICSAYLKARPSVWSKVILHGGQLHVSAITVGELFTWAARRTAGAKRRHGLVEFLETVKVLDVTSSIAERFGELRADLLDRGQAPPDFDLFIAATALEYDLTMITHNLRDFSGISGLRIQDWLGP
jgi:tRNA(fMet)-specific endonuclease VapC